MRFWMLVTALAASTGEGGAPAPPQVPALAVSSGDIAAIVMLLGFLGLIGGILFRWSSDTSFKERSVFSRPNR
jgi:hypothetical protein